MQRNEEDTDRGRRPLLLGNNRQMLQEIRDSLRHLQKEGESNGKPESAQFKTDLSQSTPNLLEKMGNAGKNMSRLGYNKKAMAEIRQSLANYQIIDAASAGLNHIVVPNGLDEVTPVNRHMLRQLMAMGWDEEVASRSLKISGNKSVDAALDTIQKLSHHEGKNGFAKVGTSGLHGYGSKVVRKPSFEEKYRQGSPVNSENSSVRSDSPSIYQQRQFLVESMSSHRQTNPQVNLTVPFTEQLACSDRSDRQTPPPPLPPRGVPPTQTPPPPPLPPYLHAELNNESSYQPVIMQSGHSQHVIYQSLVQRDTTSNLQETLMASLQPNTVYTPGSSGPVTPQRGTSPDFGRELPSVILQSSVNAGMHNYNHPSMGYQINEDASSRPMHSTTLTQGQSSQKITFTYTKPPYYQQQLLQSKTSPTLPVHEQSHMIVSHVQSNNSPLSSHSPSPGPIHSPGQPSPVMKIHIQPVVPSHVPSYSQGQNQSFQPAGHTSETPRPALMQAWNAKQPPIIMQQVKSREVQKPILQTATAPMAPAMQPQQQQNFVSSVQAQVNTPPSPQPHHHLQQQQQSSVQAQVNTPPSPQPHHYLQQQQQYHHQQFNAGHQNLGHFQMENIPHSQHLGLSHHQNYQANIHGHIRTIQINTNGPSVHIQQSVGHGSDFHLYQHHNLHRNFTIDNADSISRSDSPVSRATNQSPMSVISTVSTPSTNSDIPDKPPPPYPGKYIHSSSNTFLHHPEATLSHAHPYMLYAQGDPQQMYDNIPGHISGFPDALPETYERLCTQSEPVQEVEGKRLCSSPKPERKPDARKKDAERQETKVPHSPQAFKFFMEQHIENVLKSHQQRIHRRVQLETEMRKVGLSDEAQNQMRKMLHQKESNYIRLKRAKMDKAMFDKIKTLGVGAFGEVALVRKKDTNALYAMKTLSKHDVLQRNQAAHVKAERDILAEADNEWVVKLYYSFQDKDKLYFVMDYIPGGDMMSLLIKYGIFNFALAQFYIAELVLAIESVHKMGFIHRDIKPDNILIDKDGHIKLTDFGLCTGFRWTHNSKYYQQGNHIRQDSMEPETWGETHHSQKELLKPLERRKLKHQRNLAHSLVGTPNYIAPEVLARSGYTSCCDWWSVGVILYEMLLGQPPFLANSPQETQMKIIHWESTLNIPQEANLSREASDIIVKLCCGPEKRLGQNGAVQIKQHPFFYGVQFDILRRQTAPHTPKIKYPTDTSNFDPVDPEKLRGSGSDDSLDSKSMKAFENGRHTEHAFFEFTFRRFFDDGGHPYAIKNKDPDSKAPVYV